jgi:type IV secretion system protein VirB9
MMVFLKPFRLGITMIALAINMFVCLDAMALRKPRPMPIDSRIQIINYNPDDVFSFTGFYGYQSSIEFAEDETVESISMGDSLAWQIVPSGRRIFLKPIEPDAVTNMTVLSNHRLYHFELHAEEAEDIHDERLVFTLRFLYPDEGAVAGGGIHQYASSSLPDLETPEKYNFDYTVSGSEMSAPIKVFDDGEFTYFQFRNKNAEVPAFFTVDMMGNESIVNYRVAGEYIVLERVASVLTLRNGRDITCVFNENMPMILDKPKSRKQKQKRLGLREQP